MELVKLDEKEYRNYWENHPQKTFLSSPEIGKLREKNGWKVDYVGHLYENKLVGAAMLLSHKRRFGKYEYYCPRGVLTDYNDEKMLTLFLENIKKYVEEHNGYIFRMDPYIINKERDIDGNIVKNGIDNSIVKKYLKKLDFRKVKEEDMEQVGWMFSLDLENKSEEDILKGMKPNTRNTIRKTEKIGIELKELKIDELDKFMDIMEQTGNRKNFNVRKLNYYKDMYELFHDKGEIKYIITTLDLKKYIHDIRNTKKEKKEQLEKLKNAKYNDGIRKQLTNEIESLKNKENDTEELMKRSGKDEIILSGSMFMLIKPEIIYLSSGNYEEYLHFNSQYLIQWEMIKYGIKNGFKKHNFYGIPANINEHPKNYGIYEFKRGYGGYVEELIGEYEVPISWQYYLLKLIHKLRKR